MSKNKKLEIFRSSATPEQWRDLIADHEELTSEDFREKYRFSWSGIFPDAVAGGYYVPARKQKTTANSDSSDSKAIKVTFPPFIIDDDSVSEDLTTRSVQFYTGLVERLSKLETRKKVYTKRAIINHLLDVALRHFGF